MRFRSAVVSSSLALALAVSAGAMAQDQASPQAQPGQNIPAGVPSGHHWNHRGHGMPSTGEFLQKHGGSADNVTRAQFTQSEIAQSTQRADGMFNHFDTNHDGILTAAEVDAGRTQRKARRAERRAQRASHNAQGNQAGGSSNMQ
jgi:hypothetical protein